MEAWSIHNLSKKKVIFGPSSVLEWCPYMSGRTIQVWRKCKRIIIKIHISRRQLLFGDSLIWILKYYSDGYYSIRNRYIDFGKLIVSSENAGKRPKGQEIRYFRSRQIHHAKYWCWELHGAEGKTLGFRLMWWQFESNDLQHFPLSRGMPAWSFTCAEKGPQTDHLIMYSRAISDCPLPLNYQLH